MPDTAWTEYYKNTKDAPPRPLLVEAMQYAFKKDSALDIGSGAFNDVRYLLQEGFRHVTALDKEAVAQEVYETLPKGSVSYVISTFEAYEFPPAAFDLVNAQYSLPFVAPFIFSRVYAAILASLRPGAVFTGQFFGVFDDWAGTNGMSFHTRPQVEEMLKGLQTVVLREEEKDAPTAAGMTKHWHIFHFIAIK